MAKNAKPVTAWALVLDGELFPWLIYESREAARIAKRGTFVGNASERIAKVRITEVGRG